MICRTFQTTVWPWSSYLMRQTHSLSIQFQQLQMKWPQEQCNEKTPIISEKTKNHFNEQFFYHLFFVFLLLEADPSFAIWSMLCRPHRLLLPNCPDCLFKNASQSCGSCGRIYLRPIVSSWKWWLADAWLWELLKPLAAELATVSPVIFKWKWERKKVLVTD